MQIGLGSMGKRRIRNLLFHKIPKENIYGFDPLKKRRLEAQNNFGIKIFNNFKKTLDRVKPDVFIISTPPDKHSDYFLYAAKHKKHFFVEHPTTDKGYKQLMGLLDGTFVGAPSCSLRFHPAIKAMKKILDSDKIGRVLSFQYHMGQYLPDWHPWEDYRKVYFSKRPTGACREMFAFELGWLSYVLNLKVEKIAGFTEKLSGLDMNADDLYASIIRFQNNVIGNISIDILSRKPFRTLRVIGSNGVLEWEWQDSRIELFTAKDKKLQVIHLKKGHNEKHYITTEDMYEEEIGRFLTAIEGRSKYPFLFKENHRFLKALFALEKSSRTGKTVTVI
ncbi:MAG: Gfo/Idh/MocA family oxidoreductase [Minisyncoccia bacterium]|jgi:predicted dehydrogenase